jgi:hypothetical protein
VTSSTVTTTDAVADVNSAPCDVIWCRGCEEAYEDERATFPRRDRFDCRENGFHEGRQWAFSGGNLDMRLCLYSAAEDLDEDYDASIPGPDYPILVHCENADTVGAFEAVLNVEELDDLISMLNRARGDLVADLNRYGRGGHLRRAR